VGELAFLEVHRQDDLLFAEGRGHTVPCGIEMRAMEHVPGRVRN